MALSLFAVGGSSAAERDAESRTAGCYPLE